MSRGRLLGGAVLALLLALPFLPMGGTRQQYVLHVVIQIFIWSFIGQAWSLMGRFGLVSLGHGAFLGVGAYTTTLLWNFYSLTPWIGVLIAVAAAVGIAVVLGIPSFRFRVVGHYFALVTLAVGEVIRLLIIAERDWTGGSLGLTLKTAGSDWSVFAVQFADKRVFYYASLALFLAGLWVWDRVDRSMARSGLEAIGEDETAAASVGIHVTRFKLGITVLSAALTAVGGVLYAQYFSYVNPDTLSGIGVSLKIVFAVVLGGMYSLLGPLVGTALTTALSEGLRIAFGLKLLGMAETIYGLLLIIFIIFLPSGIYGSLRQLLRRRAAKVAVIALLLVSVSMAPPVLAQDEVFSARVLATGLGSPWQITWGPDGYLWVTERQARRVSRVHPASGARTVALTIDEAFASDYQEGVLGMALHPQLLWGTGEDYAYVAYTYREGAVPTGRRRAKIRRYTYDPSTHTLGKPLDVISGLPASSDHNSGRLKISPDGKLFYTIGDQGANHATNKCNVNRAQDLPSATEVGARDWSTYQGKILRLNLDGSIPADNPLIGNVRSHVYSYGHRNAQGIVFGPGGTLYSSEHGPKTDDEVNVIQAGKNYGWPRVAGYIDDKAYTYDNWSASAPTPCTALQFNAVHTPPSVPRLKESSFSDPNFVPPIKTFGTVDNDFKFERPDCSGNACYPSIAPSSIEIYPGTVTAAIPRWVSSLLIPSLKRGSVFRLKLSADGSSIIGEERELWRSKNRYRDLAIHPDGRTFYIATDTEGDNPGAILEFQYQGIKPAVPTR